MAQPNYFDRFDARPDGGAGNYFDQFDAAPTPAGGGKFNPLAAAGLGVVDGLTFGWGDELLGMAAGEDAKWRMRDALARAQDERGGAFMAGQFGSALIPGLGAAKLGGQALRTAGRTLGRLPMGAQMAVGAGVGAVSGGIGGAGRADEGDRAGGAVSGAAMGAGFGAVAPVAGAALSRVMGATRVGPTAMARAVDAGDIPAQGAIPTELSAVDDFIRVMDRSPRRTVEDLTAYVDDAQKDPGRGRTFMDALERAGVKRMKALTKAPGRTADDAEQAFAGRAQGQRQRLEQELLGRAGMTSLDAEKEVARLYDEVGEEFYRPVLNAPMSPAQMEAFSEQVLPLRQNRWFGMATDKADELIGNDILLGKLPPGAANSLSHKLHYTKLAFDTMIARMKRSAELDAAAGTELRQLVEIKQRFLKALDPHNPSDPLSPKGGGILPGYSQARKEFGGIVEADDAIEAGRAVFRPGTWRTPEHLREYVQGLSNFERKFFLAGVEDEISRVLASANTDGRRNLAAQFLNDGRMDRLKAIFPPHTVARIERALRAEDELFRMGSAARTGSDTGVFVGEMAEQMGAMAQGAQAPTIPGMAQAAWRNSIGAILGELNAAGMERRGDQLGQMLLMRLDDPTTAPQVRAFLEQVAQRLAQRELAQRSMLGGAAATGMMGGHGG